MTQPLLTTTWVINPTAVRYHREIQDLTQREVAARMGRSANLLSEIERGAFAPTSLRVIGRLARALGVEVTDIAAPAEQVA